MVGEQAARAHACARSKQLVLSSMRARRAAARLAPYTAKRLKVPEVANKNTLANVIDPFTPFYAAPSCFVKWFDFCFRLPASSPVCCLSEMLWDDDDAVDALRRSSKQPETPLSLSSGTADTAETQRWKSDRAQAAASYLKAFTSTLVAALLKANVGTVTSTSDAPSVPLNDCFLVDSRDVHSLVGAYAAPSAVRVLHLNEFACTSSPIFVGASHIHRIS